LPLAFWSQLGRFEGSYFTKDIIAETDPKDDSAAG